MYELHIGLPRSAVTLRQQLLTTSDLPLKVSQAGASSSEPGGESLRYQAHEVGDGGLDTLFTYRTTSMHSLVEGAKLAVRLCAPNVNVRVEGEKILFKSIVGDAESENFQPIENGQFSFDGVRTLPIPQFEAHLAISWTEESLSDTPLIDAGQLSGTLGYTFHQSTEFPDKHKVVLTTFHPTVGAMEASVRSVLQSSTSFPGIRMVVTAEQVLFCIAPEGHDL